MKFMKKKSNKKGFTILELLVVVAIIAILAVIAIPQFMGAIDKSRVSAQIADMASVSKAIVMYNFDTSMYPEAPADAAAVTTLKAVVGNSKGWVTQASSSVVANNILLGDQDPDALAVYTGVPGYNGPYLSTYPATNKWSGGFTYKIIGATPTAGEALAGLAAGQIVIELTAIPNSQLQKMETAVDNTTPTAGFAAGVFRLNHGTPASATIGYYVVK